MDVLIGASQKLPVRLVAQMLPQEIAAERRRKAKANRDRRCKPSKASLTLLGWEIFITNVPRDIWSSNDPQILEFRGLKVALGIFNRISHSKPVALIDRIIAHLNLENDVLPQQK